MAIQQDFSASLEICCFSSQTRWATKGNKSTGAFLNQKFGFWNQGYSDSDLMYGLFFDIDNTMLDDASFL